MLSRLRGVTRVTPFGGEETGLQGVGGKAGDWGVGQDLNPGRSVFRGPTRFFSKPWMRSRGRDTKQPAEDWRPPALEI